jgi:hypothetical protein
MTATETLLFTGLVVVCASQAICLLLAGAVWLAGRQMRRG